MASHTGARQSRTNIDRGRVKRAGGLGARCRVEPGRLAGRAYDELAVSGHQIDVIASHGMVNDPIGVEGDDLSLERKHRDGAR